MKMVWNDIKQPRRPRDPGRKPKREGISKPDRIKKTFTGKTSVAEIMEGVKCDPSCVFVETEVNRSIYESCITAYYTKLSSHYPSNSEYKKSIEAWTKKKNSFDALARKYINDMVFYVKQIDKFKSLNKTLPYVSYECDRYTKRAFDRLNAFKQKYKDIL